MDDYSKLKYLITKLMLHTPVIEMPVQANERWDQLKEQQQRASPGSGAKNPGRQKIT